MVALRGLIYSHIVPLWQAPDEPGHFEYACTLSRLGRLPTQADVDRSLEQAIIASLDRADFWRLTRQARPVPLPQSFAENRFLRMSGSQLGDEPPLYYLIPALLCRAAGTLEPPGPLARPGHAARAGGAAGAGRGVEKQARLMRWYSVVLLIAATWLAWRAAHELWPLPGQRWLNVGVPAFYALAPMPTFMGMAINNDSLALLVCTAFYAALTRFWRSRGSTASAVALLLAAGMAVLSKRTALFLAPTALLVLASSMVTRYRAGRPDAEGDAPREASLRRSRLPAHGERGWRSLALCGALALLAVAALALTQWRRPVAEAWRAWPGAQPAQRSTWAHTGRYALLLTDESASRRSELSQPVAPETPAALRGAEVELRAWVRAAYPRGLRGGSTVVSVLVADGHGRTARTFEAGETWQEIRITHRVASEPGYLRAAVGIGAPGDRTPMGALLADDIRMTVRGGEQNLLKNGGAERGARYIAPILEVIGRYITLPYEWPQALVAATSYRLDALERYGLYVALTFAGFWGNFGWLQLPLPVPVYAVLAFVCLLAGAGLLRLARACRTHGAESRRDAETRRHGEVACRSAHAGSQRPPSGGIANIELTTWQRETLRWLVLSVALAAVQIFLPMIGTAWQPQGRYLFPVLWPLANLLLLGLGCLVRPAARRTLLAAWIAGLVTLDGLALLITIVPAYR